MTNEEKARELAIKNTTLASYNGNEVYSIGCEVACNEMAEWKDRQTIEKWHAVLNWLERNAKKYCCSYGAASYDTGMMVYELREAMEGGEQ